ncbi:RNase H domain-containing protein [Trichonephila clavipes]|nr:RNase H domain-containing protein [Trichonephila clavipes]
MGKKGDFSLCKKAEVSSLVNAKLFSNREISRKLKVSEASVRCIKTKIESGEELSPKRKKKMRQKAYFHPKNKTQFVRRRDGEKFHSDCVVRTVKHPTKIMIWSVISGKGTGRLDVVKGMMRQDQLALEYATPIWTPASISVKRKLDSVQHRAAKIIIGAVSSTNNEKAEQECGLPPLESRRKLATIKITNKLRSYGLDHISRRGFDKWKHSTRLKRSSTLQLDSEIRK